MNKTQNLTRNEKLTILANHLIDVVEFENKGFDLIEWKNDCGTVACAAGYAAELPVFNELGFVISKNAMQRFIPSYQDLHGWSAITCFFELNLDQAEYFFLASKYKNLYKTTPKQVATRIFEFVKENPDT